MVALETKRNGLAGAEESGDLLFTTLPAGREPFKQRLSKVLSAAILPFLSRAAGAYIGGQRVEEALAVVERLAGEGYAATLGYWDHGSESPDAVAALYEEAIAALAAGAGSYLSLKPPAFRYSATLARRLAGLAAGKSLRLHCDSHGIETVEPSNAFCEALLAHLPPALVSTTLPGRWGRSLADADWALAKEIGVRVVKGQWGDPAAPARDLSEGFLAVIDRLATGARHVAVATQDALLAQEAITRLKRAGISCEVEVLLGLSAKPLLAWTKANAIPTRVYVPYGPGFIPNAIGVLRRNPRLLVSVVQERCRALLGRG